MSFSRPGEKPSALERCRRPRIGRRAHSRICWECAQNQATCGSKLQGSLERELNLARTALLDSSRKVSAALSCLRRGRISRTTERHRSDVTALCHRATPGRANASDTCFSIYSAFARRTIPSANSDRRPGEKRRRECKGFEFSADAGIAKSESFLERWTAHAVASAVNQDLEAKTEIAPRLNPNGRMEENAFFLTETNERILLDAETLGALRQCDGSKSAHELPLSTERLHQLARQNIIRWQLEVEAMEPRAFERLLQTIRQLARHSGARRAGWKCWSQSRRFPNRSCKRRT